MSKQDSYQSKAAHPLTGYTDTLFANVALTLTRWPWYTNWLSEGVPP